MTEIIAGDNGEWIWSITGDRPQRISLNYFPNAGTCRDIRLSQSVSKIAFDANGGIVTSRTGEMFKPGRNPFAHADDDTIDRVLTGADAPPTYIDHHACEGDPYYNGEDTLLETPSRGDATATPPTFTRLTDDPGGPMDDFKDEIVQVDTEFETCAICAETGRILGCIRWVSRITRTHPGRIAVLTRDHDARATGAFLAAFHRFCQTHTALDSAGKLRFRCPEGAVNVGGVRIPPERGEVPGPFGRYWIQASRRLDLAPELGGGGQRFQSLGVALAACVERPARAAIKLTWSGFQEKTRRSIVFTGWETLEARDLEPFVDEDPAMRNDLRGLDAVPVTPAFLGALAAGLREAAGRKQPESAPVRLAAIADLGTGKACGFTGPFECKALEPALEAAAATLDAEDHQVRAAVAYALLNFARPYGPRRSVPAGRKGSK